MIRFFYYWYSLGLHSFLQDDEVKKSKIDVLVAYLIKLSKPTKEFLWLLSGAGGSQIVDKEVGGREYGLSSYFLSVGLIQCNIYRPLTPIHISIE